MISGRVDIGSCREFPQARRVLGNAHAEVTHNVRIMPVATKKELDDVEEVGVYSSSATISNPNRTGSRGGQRLDGSEVIRIRHRQRRERSRPP